MLSPRRFRLVPGSLAFAAMLAGVGCTSMQVIQPAQVIPSQHPTSVWVKASDGEVVDVLNPTIKGDSLTGTMAQLGEPYSVALKDLTWAKAKEPNTVRTVAATVGGVAFGSAVVYGLTQQSGNSVGMPCQGEAEVEHQCNPANGNSGAF
jgi:hypothetical protein